MSIKNTTKNKLLAGVGTTVLATMIAGGAYAADTSISVAGITMGDWVPAATGHKTTDSRAVNNFSVTATAEAQTTGVQITAGDIPADDPDSVNVRSNVISATAVGNQNTNLIDLSLLANGDDADGLAAIGYSVNQDLGLIRSSVTDNNLAVVYTGAEDDSTSVIGNAIAAASTVNIGKTSIYPFLNEDGTSTEGVPNSFASTTEGSSNSSYGAGVPLDAEGSIVASSAQVNTVAGHSANAVDGSGDGNSISLTLLADDANSVDASPTLDNNTISADMGINQAQSMIDLRSDVSNPTFAGSAVATNLQLNIGTGSATNANSTIAATVAGDDVNTLEGSLSVSGNAITSTVSGNRSGGSGTAGNAIVIGDDLSVDGPDGSAGAGAQTAGASFAYNSGELNASVAADFVIHNSQGNDGGGANALQSRTQDGQISAYAQALDGGSITLDADKVASSANGNIGASVFSNQSEGTGSAATFDASIAVASQQTNNSAGVTATTNNGAIIAIAGDDGATADSTITVSNGTVSAAASGNNMSQAIALKATTLNSTASTVALGGGTNPDGNASASGTVTVTNLQSNYNSAVTATNDGSMVGLDADSRGSSDTISGSTLTTTANTQSASANGNSANSSLALDGNQLGGGAGVTSVQIGGDSAVSASLTDALMGLIAGTHSQDNTLSVTGNKQKATAAGNSAQNALSAETNSFTVAAGGTGVDVAYDAGSANVFHGTQPSVNSAFGVLNDQSILNDVTATASGVETGLMVEGSVQNTTASNDDNKVTAAAYGNDAGSTMALDGSVDSAGFAAVGMIANTQSVGGDANVSAQAYDTTPILTDVEDDTINSKVSTSNNLVQALAVGNNAGNGLTAGGNAVNVAGATDAGLTTQEPGDYDLSSTVAFGVVNAQSGSGSVSASLGDTADPDTVANSSSIITKLGSANEGTTGGVGVTYSPVVSGSTVNSDNNVLSASATSNSANTKTSDTTAGNTLVIAANHVATTSGVQNLQVSDADVSAVIGGAGTPGFDDFQVGWSVDEGQYTGNISGLPDPQKDAFIAFYQGQAGWSYDAGTGDYSFTAPGGAFGTGQFNVNGVEGTSGNGGVSIVASGGAFTDGFTISNSTLSVDGNQTLGSVTGNSATNTLAVKGTTIGTGSDLAGSEASFASDIVASADHSVSNVQAVTGDADLNSTVNGRFSIDTWLDDDNEASISNSSLSIAGNTQKATSVANTAGNSLSLSGENGSANSILAGSALVSSQSGNAAVSATSGLDIQTAIAVSGSTVDMSNNSNVALGVLNDVTNTSTVSASNISTMDDANATAGTVGNATGATSTADISADHVVLNSQSATTSATSSARTQITNLDAVALDTAGVQNSTITVTGNKTISEASANRATNQLALNGEATLGASGGLFNSQTSTATVQSDATTVAKLTLSGDAGEDTAASANSTIALNGNSTSALARGNSATNTLTALAGANYGVSAGGSSGASAGTTDTTAYATYTVLNAQSNTGGVSAQSAGAVYQVALNSAADAASIGNSSVSVQGNSVTADAYGNTASNSISLTGLNTGSPTAALASRQVNSGAITASVTGANLGISSTGLVGGSSLGVTGNSISANAIGNSVSNVIGRK